MVKEGEHRLRIQSSPSSSAKNRGVVLRMRSPVPLKEIPAAGSKSKLLPKLGQRIARRGRYLRESNLAGYQQRPEALIWCL